ncbi:MAG: ParM/StbA family protein [Acidiphilium sp.]|nr:ParM/StbA family protein [Acidiphilium sp.]
MDQVVSEQVSVRTTAAPSVAIGFDIGHSAVKLAWLGEHGTPLSLLFRSCVRPAFAISNEETAQRARAETVVCNGQMYFFGETAAIQSEPGGANGLIADWVESVEYRVLVSAATAQLESAGVRVGDALVVCGLPTSQFGRHGTKLAALMREVTGAREVQVKPQPMGAYQYVRLTDRGGASGQIRPGENWGVIDIGRYSTDFMAMMGTSWVERAADSCGGFRLVAGHLKTLLVERGLDVDDDDCDTAAFEGTVRQFGRTVDVSAEAREAVRRATTEITDVALRVLGPFSKKLDGVLVAGGAAGVFIEGIRAIFPHARDVQHGRIAIAEGFRRLGAGILRARQLP